MFESRDAAARRLIDGYERAHPLVAGVVLIASRSYGVESAERTAEFAVRNKGRVALLLSDHAWLWARGYDGGGPHTDLLRRLSHWLMKQPDLEEEALRLLREAEVDVAGRDAHLGAGEGSGRGGVVHGVVS